MKKERRRLRLAQRQLLLAQVSERAAMRSLAEALAEEKRSRALAERSRALVEQYSRVAGKLDGGGVARHQGFVGALGALALDADNAGSDAASQAQWQVDLLADARQRSNRNTERLQQARDGYRHALERRSNQETESAKPRLARKLHSGSEN